MFKDFDEFNPVRNDQLIDDTLNYAKNNDNIWEQYAWSAHDTKVCDTTYCLAGFRAFLDGFTFIYSNEVDYLGFQYASEIKTDDNSNSTMTIMEYARKRFGLNHREADELFFESENLIYDVIRDIKNNVYRHNDEDEDEDSE